MRRASLAIVLVALLGASCAGTPARSPTSSGSAPTSVAPSTTSPPSALDSLSAFFTRAADVDRRLKAAAVDANGAIGTTEITISRATLDAIAAADPTPVAQAIPAGLPPDVLLPVLTVQSDLESRFYAFRGFVEAQPGTIARTPRQPGYLSAADYLLICLGSGSPAAASFAADVAAARATASRAPEVPAIDPASQTAADLAIWLRQIREANSGCDSCGGARTSSLDPITWHHVAPLTPGGNAWDGDVGGLLFTARYSPSQGWTVDLNAC